jgi:ribose/xylose/arabinose/galactoside ABC-type transport system permease subunit
MFVFLVVLVVVVGIINPAFFNFMNIVNVLRSISFLTLAALGMTFVLVGGGLDLSVGSVIGLGGMVTGLLLQAAVPVLFAILGGLAVGSAIGLMNGMIITKAKIPPLIVTLGSLYMARGVILVLTRGRPVYPFPDAFNAIGTGAFLGIPYSVYILLFFVVFFSVLLSRTVYGRSIYAIGGNEETARNAGIPVDRIKIISYVIVGALGALTGILMSARMNSAVPNSGEGWELRVIASVIIGGTSMFGGVGTIGGTVIGASVMSILSTAMIMLRISAYWQNIVVGAIIILAVGIDQYRRSGLR